MPIYTFLFLNTIEVMLDCKCRLLESSYLKESRYVKTLMYHGILVYMAIITCVTITMRWVVHNEILKVFAREVFYLKRPIMASFLKSKFSSSSNHSQNQNPRVQPHSHDPTLAWEKLKVKQVVKK